MKRNESNVRKVLNLYIKDLGVLKYRGKDRWIDTDVDREREKAEMSCDRII